MTTHMGKERDASSSTPIAKPVVLVFMGVSGCGKTTVAAILAGRLGWRFEEGDAPVSYTHLTLPTIYSV